MLGSGAELRHVLQLQVTKDALREWARPTLPPGVFQEIVTGLYARVFVNVEGQKVGRVCRITGVRTGAAYVLLNLSTSLWLEVTYGGSTTAVKMTQINDSCFNAGEFDAWLKTFGSSFPPSAHELEKKWDRLKEVREAQRKGLPLGGAAAPATTLPPSSTLLPGAPAPLQPVRQPEHPTLEQLSHPNPYHPFFESKLWLGRKERYYFGSGTRGLGYYLDPVAALAATAQPPAAKATRRPGSPPPRAEAPVKPPVVEATPLSAGGWSTVPQASPSPPPPPVASTDTSGKQAAANPFKVDVSLPTPSAARMKDGAYAVTGAWTTTYEDVKRTAKEAEEQKRAVDTRTFEELPEYMRVQLIENARVEVETLVAGARAEAARAEEEAARLEAVLAVRRGTDLDRAVEAEKEAHKDLAAAREVRRKEVDEAAIRGERAKRKFAMLDSDKEDRDAEYRERYAKLCTETALLKYQHGANLELEGVVREAERALATMREKHDQTAAKIKELSDAEYGLLSSIEKRNDEIAEECRRLSKRKAELESERKRLRTE